MAGEPASRTPLTEHQYRLNVLAWARGSAASSESTVRRRTSRSSPSRSARAPTGLARAI